MDDSSIRHQPFNQSTRVRVIHSHLTWSIRAVDTTTSSLIADDRNALTIWRPGCIPGASETITLRQNLYGGFDLKRTRGVHARMRWHPGVEQRGKAGIQAKQNHQHNQQ